MWAYPAGRTGKQRQWSGTPWDETGKDVWVHTQVTVRARGETLTIFLKGYHPFAVQGGATLFDDVRVVDLAPGQLHLIVST